MTTDENRCPSVIHVSGVDKQTHVSVIYADSHIPVIPDFPSDIPAVYWNFVYLVSHCGWDLLSTCETQSVPVRGKQAAVISQTVSRNYASGMFGEYKSIKIPP